MQTMDWTIIQAVQLIVLGFAVYNRHISASVGVRLVPRPGAPKP